MNTTLDRHTLHGFLGTPEEWELLQPTTSWDLLSDESLANKTLTSWAEWFNSRQSSTQKLLIGYSLGGRLALHALIQNPALWKGAIIISTHPGLKTPIDRQMRLEHDLLWAKRFLTDPWDHLMNDWNQQPVFASDAAVSRELDRQSLYRAMMQWSLGTQADLRPQIAQLDLPILWITGEKDSKFCKLAREVKLTHPLSKFWIAPQVGHRVHWAEQSNLIKRINEFEVTLCHAQQKPRGLKLKPTKT